jgi:hypothetical protein
LTAGAGRRFKRKPGVDHPRSGQEKKVGNGLFRRNPKGFQVRAAQRDQDGDHALTLAVATAIDEAIASASAERDGLGKRINDVIAVAAIVGGNADDEYLVRSEQSAGLLRASDEEIRNGQQRLEVLEQNIKHYKFLRSVLQTRFPDVRLPAAQ